MATDTVPAAGLRKTFLWVTRLLSYLIYFYLLVVEVVLAVGFFLLLFGANPTAAFTQWVYRNLDRAMAPFRGIFRPVELGTTSSDVPAVFETSVLFAMVVYGIVALVFSAFIAWLTHRLNSIEHQEQELEHQRAEFQRRQIDYQRQLVEEQRLATLQAAVVGQTAPDGGAST
jgi:YGGT family